MAVEYASKLPWTVERVGSNARSKYRIVDARGLTVAWVYRGSANHARDNADFIVKVVEAWTQKS